MSWLIASNGIIFAVAFFMAGYLFHEVMAHVKKAKNSRQIIDELEEGYEPIDDPDAEYEPGPEDIFSYYIVFLSDQGTNWATLNSDAELVTIEAIKKAAETISEKCNNGQAVVLTSWQRITT